MLITILIPAFKLLAVLSQIATIYVAIKVFRGEA
jgi:hypothetical protein